MLYADVDSNEGAELTVNERVKNVFSVLLHQVVDVPENATTCRASVKLASYTRSLLLLTTLCRWLVLVGWEERVGIRTRK